MKLSLMAAVSENGIIGAEEVIPWSVRGEQLLFKAMTFNQWLLIGRKTFDSMGKLPDRKYAVISRSRVISDDPDIMYFSSVEQALIVLSKFAEHVFVAGGGQIYKTLIEKVDIVHLSIVHSSVEGNVAFPNMPGHFEKVFEQKFESNVDYTYQIWRKNWQ